MILTKANKVLAEDVGYERYVTLFMTRLNSRTRSAAYVNAGHVPAYIFGASGEILSVLKRSGMPLGLRPDTVYHESGEIELAPGQMMVILTDGFEEGVGANEEMFGIDRVLEFIRTYRDLSAAEIVNQLYARFREFTGNSPQLDDLTAIVIKVK